jgi:hypothetical protein
MKLNKTKLLIGIVLVPITGAYAFLTAMFTSMAFPSYNTHNLFDFSTNILFIMGIFGLLGLIGVWLLFIFDNFENKFKKMITALFIGLGVFAALYVSYISFTDFVGFENSTRSIDDFMLTWGLWLFAPVMLFLAKRKLFPKL